MNVVACLSTLNGYEKYRVQMCTLFLDYTCLNAFVNLLTLLIAFRTSFTTDANVLFTQLINTARN